VVVQAWGTEKAINDFLNEGFKGGILND